MADQTHSPFPVFIFLIIWWSMQPNLKESRDYLKSIDKKMHTHAADGSVNGIRGWY